MTLLEFKIFFEEYLSDNYSLTDVQFDNVPYTPSKNTPYIYSQILNDRSFSVIKGDGTKTRHEGKLRFYIYTPLRSGTNKSYEIADTLIGLLERKRLSQEISTRAARPYPANNIGDFNRFVVEVPYILN